MTPVVLSGVAFLGLVPKDPAPSIWRGRDEARSLECERLLGDFAEAERLGEVKPERARGSLSERDVLACRQRLLAPGLREPSDEAILRDLEGRVGRVAAQVSSTEAAPRTWLVESFTVNPVVGTKVAFAMKSALMAERLAVSDRLPLLSAGDVSILASLPPTSKYGVACARWYATGQLRDDDALLGLVTLDRRETNLHPGICIEGRWSWLR